MAVRAHDPRDDRGEVYLDRLLGCDATLAVIASDVDGLLGDLAEMRRRAEALEERCAEHDDVVREQDAVIARLEDERDRLRDMLEHRAQALAATEREPAAARATPGATIATHVRFVALPGGYHLTTSDEPCAEPGDRIVLDDHPFLVTKVGRSPLPDDPRPCAFLLADAPWN